ncbi:MAG: hypothetical protein JWN65_2718 [Solirubrobacterales bacterium]|nr:hypothetical protein [Solirubrobacterales bacterium]
MTWLNPHQTAQLLGIRVEQINDLVSTRALIAFGRGDDACYNAAAVGQLRAAAISAQAFGARNQILTLQRNATLEPATGDT